jgi:hypothetical protein
VWPKTATDSWPYSAEWRCQLVGNTVERLFQVTSLELALAAFARADHRGLQAVGVIHKGDTAWPARTAVAAALGVERVAVDLLDTIAYALDDDAAAPGTHVAVVVGGLDFAPIIPGLQLVFCTGCGGSVGEVPDR